MAIITVSMIFAAMFSAFSYISDYLSGVTKINNNYISAMLILFGVCGFIGNFIFSHFLQKNVIQTTHYYPLIFGIVLLLVWWLGFSPLAMCLLTVFWGICHSSGLVVSQTWLMGEASEAPEFANSLYMSFSNLGITIGSLTAVVALVIMINHPTAGAHFGGSVAAPVFGNIIGPVLKYLNVPPDALYSTNTDIASAPAPVTAH